MAVHCRKNQASLSTAERNRFVAAVLAIKADGAYDDLVNQHLGAMSSAHRGPAFLPWHREYLRRFELALQDVDPQVTLPYWDWSVDNSETSSLWDASFLGGNGRPSDGVVTSGPFAHSTGNWTLVFDGPALRRRFGMSTPSLPSPADVTAALAEAVYDVMPWSTASVSGFRNRLEGWISGPQLHNRVHVWVGGSMGPMSSPNDPVFFLHHCFIDKLWADWQVMHPSAGFLPVSGAPTGHNLGDAMEPWLGQGESITIASVLDHHALGYAYDTERVCHPTLKFRDDIPTLKFRDDIPTLKFRDDGGSGMTATKAFDDVKLPALDDPNVFKPQQDVVFPPGNVGRPAPFVLSTPHHSMAWAQEQPELLRATAAELESELTQLSMLIADHEQAQQRGQLTTADVEALSHYRADYDAVLAEYQRLTGGGIM